MTLQVNQTFNTAVRLTFDVRGLPKAGPLDGGVRRLLDRLHFDYLE